MYAKTYAVAFIAIWLFNASLAAPAPEPEPEPHHCGGCGCSVSKIQTLPVSSHIAVKTTHKILPNSGCGGGWVGGYGCDSGCGWDSGCGGWGNGCGWDSGCGGWGNGCEGGWGDCAITRVHHVPVITHLPIKTTHRVLPHSDCGVSNVGYGTWAGHGNGCGCGCGCSGLC